MKKRIRGQKVDNLIFIVMLTIIAIIYGSIGLSFSNKQSTGTKFICSYYSGCRVYNDLHFFEYKE